MTPTETIIQLLTDLRNFLYISGQGNFFYRWQDLIGAFLGVIGSYWILRISSNITKKEKDIQDLFYIQNTLDGQINILAEIEIDVTRFLNKQLPHFMNIIEKNSDTEYSVNKVFFPISPYTSMNIQILNIDTGSGYINSKIGFLYKFSQIFFTNVEQIKKQLDYTYEITKEVSIHKLQKPTTQKKEYLNNLSSFSEATTKQFLKNNIPIFVKNLAQATVAINELKRIGVKTWKHKFEAKYKHLKINVSKGNQNAHETIENYLKDEENKIISKFNNFVELGLQEETS